MSTVQNQLLQDMSVDARQGNREPLWCYQLPAATAFLYWCVKVGVGALCPVTGRPEFVLLHDVVGIKCVIAHQRHNKTIASVPRHNAQGPKIPKLQTFTANSQSYGFGHRTTAAFDLSFANSAAVTDAPITPNSPDSHQAAAAEISEGLNSRRNVQNTVGITIKRRSDVLRALTRGTLLAQNDAQLPTREADPPTPRGSQEPASSEFLGTAVHEPHEVESDPG